MRQTFETTKRTSSQPPKEIWMIFLRGVDNLRTPQMSSWKAEGNEPSRTRPLASTTRAPIRLSTARPETRSRNPWPPFKIMPAVVGVRICGEAQEQDEIFHTHSGTGCVSQRCAQTVLLQRLVNTGDATTSANLPGVNNAANARTPTQTHVPCTSSQQGRPRCC